MSSARIRAFIFARGGSKGIPRKNIKLLGGKPLIAHSIERALAAPSLGSVSVSTDDIEIAAIARAFGAEVPFLRPPELATDLAGEWGAWRHAIEWCESHGDPFEIMVSLPATSPFRAVEDIEACITCLLEDPSADVVVAVKHAERSPYFNMIQMDDDGYASLVCSSVGAVQRRQDSPTVYDMTTVAYATRTDFVRKQEGLFAGNVRTTIVPQERALDIDTPYDFLVAELLENHRTQNKALTENVK
jgi:N,N'-diacetyl-8-epilegionaminate cytidylyltransferase